MEIEEYIAPFNANIGIILCYMIFFRNITVY